MRCYKAGGARRSGQIRWSSSPDRMKAAVSWEALCGDDVDGDDIDYGDDGDYGCYGGYGDYGDDDVWYYGDDGDNGDDDDENDGGVG